MPSFSARVKEDLCLVPLKTKPCICAELAGLAHACGTLSLGAGGFRLKLLTEHKSVVTRIFSLVKRLYDMDPQLRQSSSPLQKEIYELRIQPADPPAFLEDLAIPFALPFRIDSASPLFAALLAEEGCRAAYLRGAILGGGVISDPNRDYHMEFISGSRASAQAVIAVLAHFSLHAKCLERKSGFSAYLKDAQSISEVLTLTGAHSCMLELENARMVKDIRNTVNRQINFENANIDKVVRSAMAQIRNIQLIAEYQGLESLSPALREAAELRLRYPEAPLSELALLSDGLSRSGINNRLRKIAEIADAIRSAHPEK